MNEVREPIRSYQRIFRPERRIYQIEGRALPVPGGVPLRWLAYATAALIAVLALSSGAATVPSACAAGLAGLLLGARPAALLAGLAGLGAAWVCGLALGLLDWPLRLIVIPVAVATLATQATPDGRQADRFAASWLALRLAPRRRSLGRALPGAGAPQLVEAALWVAPDQRAPALRRARVRGAGTVGFAAEVRVRRRSGRGRLVARPAAGAARRGEMSTTRLAIGAGETLEIRR